MNSFKPIILIRHPVAQVQSIYTSMTANTKTRPGGENFDLITSLQYSRLMFEYFRLSRGEIPVVIDGDDVLWRTEEVGRNFCKAFGIDPNGLKDQWDPLPQSWWASNPFIYAMTKTLVESSGIERPSQKVGRQCIYAVDDCFADSCLLLSRNHPILNGRSRSGKKSVVSRSPFS